MVIAQLLLVATLCQKGGGRPHAAHSALPWPAAESLENYEAHIVGVCPRCTGAMIRPNLQQHVLCSRDLKASDSHVYLISYTVCERQARLQQAYEP